MIRSIAFALTLFGLTWFAQADEPLTHTKDTPAEVKKNLQEKKAVLIDVRSLEEWNDGHLKDAVSIPIKDLEKKIDETKLKELAKDKIVYTHCAAGGRALKAGEILKKQGYDVRPLKMGYEDLIKEGFTKDEKPEQKK